MRLRNIPGSRETIAASEIRHWRQQETINRTYLGCFFSSAGMIVFVALMAIMMVVSLYLMITPI